MAEWIKVEKATARKPEVLRLADLLGVHPDHAFGLCVRFWFWCDDNLSTGHAPGVTNVTLDAAFGHPGFATALITVGWLRVRDGSLEVPNFDRHLSASAKSRALSGERKRKERGVIVTTLSRLDRDENVTRREEDERKNQSSKGDRKTIGSASAERGDTRSTARHRSSQSSRSPIDASAGEGRQPEPFDLSHVDWSHAIAMAEAAAKRVPPRTEDDRRAWLRFGVLADVTFGEAWLIDAAEAVVRAAETKRTRQAHFVAVLKRKAAEKHGIDEPTFTAMVRRIEIPTDVWKSPVLEVRK